LKLTTNQVDFLRIMYVWVMPAVLLGLGALILIRRKRK
jgi:cytochrome c-type biogenesis protein CcmH/NrfF